MEVVYAGEEAPSVYKKSVFLVGPTPRSQDVESWRPTMLKCLEIAGYDGVVFIPERRSGVFNCLYEDQVEWEKKHLQMADLILAWIPRNLKTMPAFTTNVEFGTYIDSGKMIYGRPHRSEKNGYLDWLYADRGLGQIHDNMISLAREANERLVESPRTGGERYVPQHIWNSASFQKWYRSQTSAGNRLDEAKVLWIYNVRGKPFCWSLWAKIWIESEGRYKENEFVLTRSDISTVFAYRRHDDLLDSEILLVKEFRVSARTDDGFVHELPGGSSFKPDEDPFEVAAHELEEEVGIKVDPSRIKSLTSRQMAATISSHQAVLYVIELEADEVEAARKAEKSASVFGVAEDTEQTYIEVKTLRELLASKEVDWSTLGMILQGVHQSHDEAAGSAMILKHSGQ